MKKITIVLACILLVYMISGCSLSRNTPAVSTGQETPNRTNSPSDVPQGTGEQDPALKAFQAIRGFIEDFNKAAPKGCRFVNYEIKANKDGYVICTPTGYSATVKLNPAGEVAILSVTEGSLQQKLDAAKTVITMLHGGGSFPAEKTEEMNAIKQQVDSVRTEILQKIEENKNASLDTAQEEFTDLAEQAETLLQQIEDLRSKIEN